MDIRSMVAGVVIGSGVMLMLDPQWGRRRRALVRDKIVHYTRVIEHVAVRKARHARNRARGIAAETRSSLHLGHMSRPAA